MNRFSMTAICLMLYMSGAAAIAPLQITDVVVQAVGCTGVNNGTVTVTGSGGSAPANYVFTLTSGGFSATLGGAATVTFGNLLVGDYRISLADTTAPAEVATAIVTVNAALPLTVLNAGATAISALGVADGSVTVEVAGGQLFPATGLINFVIAPAPAGLVITNPTPRSVQFSNLPSNLPLDTYTVTATSADDCPPVVAELAVQAPLVVGGRPEIDAILVQPVGCTGGPANGALVISAVSGSGNPANLRYSILEPAPGRPEQESNIFANLPAGRYTVQVTDISAAFLAAEATIDLGASLPLAIVEGQGTAVTCTGLANGTILVTTQGGQLPLTYSLDGGLPIQTSNRTIPFIGLSAGVHSVTVNSADNCPEQSFEIDIRTPAALALLAPTVVQPSCFGLSDGSITVNVNGGVAPYNFSLNGGAPQQDPTFNGLAAGTYTIVVNDANNCGPLTQTITLTQPAQLTLVTTFTQPSCFGLSDGTITATVTGGTAPITFSLNGQVVSSTGLTQVFTGLAAGTYTVSVDDANDCGPVTQVVTVTQPAQLTVATSFTQPTCNGLTDGTITATVTGGTAPYTFSLDGEDKQTQQGTTYTFTGLAPADYDVSVDDANECGPEIRSVTVTQPTAVTITNITVTPANCAGVPTGSITVVASAPGVSVLQYTLSTGQTNQTGIFTGLDVGTYGVRVEAVPSQLGFCAVGSATVTATVTIVVSATTTPAECLTGVLGSITATATGGVSPIEFSIDGLNFQSSGLFENLQPGAYTVTARDASGCIGTTSVTVEAIRGITGNPLTDFISRKYCSNAC